MSDGGREAKALAKLIKVAVSKTDEFSARLETLRGALASNETALNMLSENILEEANATKAAETVGFVQLAGYLQGAEQKRAALQETRAQLIGQAQAAETDLKAAWAELKKLEHLAERAVRSQERRRLRLENAENDDLARMSAAARNRR
ncbi:MAG: flagellar FliJ family protein [Parvularculaceae bacterium]|nr:flagellar FliJ family protein [Parvularculaceae bacterium]